MKNNIEYRNLKDLKLLENNPRKISKESMEQLVKSITDNPDYFEARPIILSDRTGELVIIAGNQRYKAAKKIGLKQVPTFLLSGLTEEREREIVIRDNVSNGEWDNDILRDAWGECPLEDWGVSVSWKDESIGNQEDKVGEVKLRDKFGIPPFSIFDARSGEWQERKREWKSVIQIKGESREKTLSSSLMMKFPDLYAKISKGAKDMGITQQEYFDNYLSEDDRKKANDGCYSAGVSLFDPVVSEICARWFTPYDNAKIFDCFAGDCFKGLVFDKLGYEFTGIELREEQVKENIEQVILHNARAKYICDDGRNVLKHIPEKSQDLLFSCPPYFDLEVYSDREDDASNQKDYDSFFSILAKAYTDALKCLKDNRFIVIVVGDVRSKRDGAYYDFVGDVKKLFIAQGVKLWNDIVLVENIGAAAIRANNPMKTRKVVKTHQNILVFYKGDTKQIKNIFKEIDISAEETCKQE